MLADGVTRIRRNGSDSLRKRLHLDTPLFRETAVDFQDILNRQAFLRLA